MPRNATEIGQRRYYTWKGERLPSVTTILKALPKEWLGAWAAKMVAEYAVTIPNLADRYAADPTGTLRDLKGVPWRKRDAAADRGTAVHGAAETGATLDEVPEDARPRFEQYRNWLRAYQPRILAQEFQCWSLTEKYGGTADVLFEFGGDLWLGDIKTGSVLDHAMRLQLAAYRHADFIGADDVIDRETTRLLRNVTKAGVIHLTDHDFQFVEVDAGWAEYDAFQDVNRVARWLEATKDEAVGQIVLPQLREEIA